MTIQQFISNNPYRILGVYVGESLAKETNNKSRIAAYNKVGQVATFPMKGDDVLLSLQRSEDMALCATQTLSLPLDRIKNALFWYANSDAVWASYLNNAVDALINGKSLEAISHYEKLVCDESIRTAFVDSATHGVLHISKEQLANVLMDILSEYISKDEYVAYSAGKYNAPYLLGLFIDKNVLAVINNMIHSFLGIGHDFYTLIDNLKDTVSYMMPLLTSTANILGTEDLCYKECAENVARAIYSQGKFIITIIGNWLWNTNITVSSKKGNGVQRATSRTCDSVRICLDLMKDIADYVEESVKSLRLDDNSYKIIGDSTIKFDMEYLNQTNYNERSLALVSGRHKLWSRIKTAIWIGFLILIFIIM